MRFPIRYRAITFNAWAELSLALPQFFGIATENLVMPQIRNCYGFVTRSNFGSSDTEPESGIYHLIGIGRPPARLAIILNRAIERVNAAGVQPSCSAISGTVKRRVNGQPKMTATTASLSGCPDEPSVRDVRFARGRRLDQAEIDDPDH
jgi:hypothetical protein